MTPSDQARTFFLSLCHYIFVMDGVSFISPAMMNTLTRLRDALHAHEVALKELIPYESRETDATKRLLLSQSLYRGIQINRMIVRFFADCSDKERHPGGILKKRMRAAFLAAQVQTATSEQQSVIHEYKVATGRL